MSPPGRPKDESLGAKRQGSPISPPGRPKDESLGAQRQGSPSNAAARTPDQGLAGPGGPGERLPTDRWRAGEIAVWVLPLVAFFAFPDYLVLGSQILITALFAASLDLVLGYAGIVSLGHAAFFGLGAYTAGLLAAHGWGEPVTGLLAAALVAGVCGLGASFLVVRGTDLTRL
ncbi:MAG TPA: hypothetical protein VF229_04600, partial [Burkholderiaceae bacterium]